MTAVGIAGFDFAEYVPGVAAFPALARLNTNVDISRAASPTRSFAAGFAASLEASLGASSSASTNVNLTASPDAHLGRGPDAALGTDFDADQTARFAARPYANYAARLTAASPAETEAGPSGPNWIRLLFAPDSIGWEPPNGSSEHAARQLPSQIADAQVADAQVTGTRITDAALHSLLRAKTPGRTPGNKLPLPGVEKAGSIRQTPAKRLLNLAPDFPMNFDPDKTMTALPLALAIPLVTPPLNRDAAAAPRIAGHPNSVLPGTRTLPDFEKMAAAAPNIPLAAIRRDVEEQPLESLLAVPAHVPAHVPADTRASAVPLSDAVGADSAAAHGRAPGSLVQAEPLAHAEPAEPPESAWNRLSAGPADVAFEAHLIAKTSTKTSAGTGSPEASGEEPRKPRSNGFRRSANGEETAFQPASGQALPFHETSAISATAPAPTPANTHPAPPPKVTSNPAPPAQPATEPAQPPPAGPADSAPIRELTVRVVPPGRPPVEVRVHQQQGETHVVVRTAEETTRTALRQDLPQLVAALDRAGFRAETFTPQAAGEFLAGVVSGELSGPGELSRQDSATTGQRDFPGAQSGREPEQQQQRQRGQMHAYWLEQMEE